MDLFGYYYGFYGIDPLYIILMLPAFILSLLAQLYTKSTFTKYSRVSSQSGFTGREVAERILQANGIRIDRSMEGEKVAEDAVRIERVAGFLSDHYSPGERVLRLSPDVYDGTSLSALGVAAHECGHALQHKYNYGPLVLRSLLAVPASVLSNLAMIVIMFSGVMYFGFAATGMKWILYLGVIGFGAAFLFQLITLPVEFNASARAIAVLREHGFVTREESAHSAAVLKAAAMTYVAAAIASLMTLLWILIRLGVFRGGDD